MKTSVFLLLTFCINAAFAQKPWKCDGKAIGTYNPESNTFTDDTKLYSAVFDASGNVNYLDKPATQKVGLNALGFRQQDGFVYGIRYSGYDNQVNELCRIDSTGEIISLGKITGLTANVQYFAGAFDANGYLYATTGSGSAPYELFKIDVSKREATDLGTISYRLIDMAFDPITNDLYATSANAINNGGELIKIDISTIPAKVTSVTVLNVFMFGVFFTDAADLYGFGRSVVDNSTAYYKIDKKDGSIINAGAGPSATNADACSCPFRLSHSLQGRFNCINIEDNSMLTIAVTNITAETQKATFDLTIDKRFKFSETADQIKISIQTYFPGSIPEVYLSDAYGGTDNVISIKNIAIPVTTTAAAAKFFKLAIKARTNNFVTGEKILFQSTINVPGNSLNLGADVSDDPLTAHLDDATTLTICAAEAAPLPVTITDFKGQFDQKIAHLSWTTNHELNVQRFEVERSFNGVNFERSNVLNASGNSLAHSYQYSDVNVQGNAVVYYRIKVIDNDGSFKYTSVVVLKNNDDVKETLVYPSPFNDKIAISTFVQNKGNITISVIDGIGRKVAEKRSIVSAGDNTITLDGLTKLDEGFYFINIYNNDKLVKTKKTMKL
ncbi:MAG: T9SS type A sorting domain-containing protein [Bacteroidota bacterium]